MNTRAHYSISKYVSSRRIIMLSIPLILLASATVLGGCQFAPVQRATPTDTPVTPLASIRGQAWLDQCDPAGVCATITPEAIQNTASASNTDFLGISGLAVSLGKGPCPSLGHASAVTDGNGSFGFSNLEPGFYCVSILASESMSGQWMMPGVLPSDRSASSTIALAPGEQRHDLQFVWNLVNPSTPAAPTPTPTFTPSCTNRMSLVKDVTIEDGQRVDPKAKFEKIWRIRNEGTCSWTSTYSWVFVSGYQLGASDTAQQLATTVNPGEMIDIKLNLTAPSVSGTYRSYWMMRSSNGELFGTGTSFNEPVWVEIKVGPVPTPVITHWKAEYFENRTLDGTPDLIRNDKNVDFDWGRNAPADGLPSDNFSARWTRTLEFDAAVYRFSVSSDDGIRLWVDDRLVIDEWKDSDLNQKSVDLALVSGKHTIQVEYYERTGNAIISLRWKKVTHDDSSKWIARFWFNRTRDSKWALVQTPSEVDYDWSSGSPALGIPKDDFSASWTRTLDFEAARYRFSLRADDGVRLYLDDELIIDEWHDASASEVYTVEREVSGTHKLQILYYEREGNARIEFDWVKIDALNHAPVAQSDAYETFVDTSLEVPAPGVLENDTDPEGDPLTPIEVSGPTHGKLSLQENGAFSYQPDPGFTGADSFRYRASDGKLESNDTLVTIAVRKENQLPAAVDDTATTEEDTPVSIDVMANDRDLIDLPILIVSIGAPASGNAALQETAIKYTPDKDFSGKDTFTYTLEDRDGDQSSAIVTVTVLPVNDAPNAAPDSYKMDEDHILAIADPGVLENDSDVEGDPISLVLGADVKHGKLEITPVGSFIYTPDENYNGEDSFTYQAFDGDKYSPEVSVVISIAPVEDAPIAVEDQYSMLLEPELSIEKPGVLSNDIEPDGDDISAVLDQRPAHGTLDFNPDGSFRYRPDSGFSGVDEFTYWIEDGNGRSKSVIVTIEVVSGSV